MKRIFALSTIGILIIGCEKPSETPTILDPSDADTIKMPVLMWSSSGYAQKYHLYVYQGQPEAGNLVVSELQSETTYAFTNTLYPATYYWKVEVNGNSTGYSRFVTYSLDETYFPVGPGYVWEYLETYHFWGCFGDSCDTSSFTVEITSLISQGDSLLVALSGPNYFTGKTYVYKNDSVYFFCVDQRLTSISLIPHDGEPMYDHEADQPRPDLWAGKNTDSTFSWGWGWVDSNLPYRFGSRYEYWQKGKGMYLYDEGEDWHPNDPGQDPAVGGWSHRKLLVKLNTGQ